jgi:hypothetical protein
VTAGISAHHIRDTLTSSSADQNRSDEIDLAVQQRMSRYLNAYGVELTNGHSSRTPLTSPPERVSIVVPTAGHRDAGGHRFIDRLLMSLSKNPSQHELDVTVVTSPGMGNVSASDLSVACVPYQEPFNFSDACNLGASHGQGDVLAFVNDDIEVTDSHWLDELVALSRLPNVGAVGPVLMYPDGAVQSAGHVDPGPTTFARGHRLGGGDDSWVDDQLSSIRNATGITAACMVVRRAVFRAVGGFDSSFPLAFNDVDLCNRFIDAGYRVVVSPTSSVIHHESRTRSGGASRDEEQRLLNHWPDRHRMGRPDAFLG